MRPYYSHAGIEIYLGDSRDVVAALAAEAGRMAGDAAAEAQIADAFATDPPYGVGLTQRKYKHSVKKGSYTKFEDTPENVRATVVPVVRELLLRVPRGAVTPGTRMMYSYPEPEETGWWWQEAGGDYRRWGFGCGQPIMYYGKCPYLGAGKGARPSGVSGHAGRVVENGHPCPKPLGFAKWLVERVSLPGETVLDPFMGSGTTMLACKLAGRRGIGVELEEAYCEIAARLLAQEVLF